MFDLSCKRCGYSWNYKGKSVWFACCPRCRGAVSLRSFREKSELNEGVKKNGY